MAKQAISSQPTRTNRTAESLKSVKTQVSRNFRTLLTHEISKKKIIIKHALIKSIKNKEIISKQEPQIIDIKPVISSEKIIIDLAEKYNTTNISIDTMAKEKTFISTKSVDEINQIIKKIALGFSAHKNESSFYISEGLFENTHFNLSCQKNELDLRLSHCSEENKHLLRYYSGYLASRLKSKEINLRRIVFT